MRFLPRIALVAFFALGSAFGESSQFYSAKYDPETDTYSSAYVVNIAVGANSFYQAGYTGGSTIIGNIEGGTVWLGHEVFNRFITTSDTYYTYDNSAAGGLNEADFHATMVGHILAGAGDGVGNYDVTAGMAPYAGLWSAGIATEFSGSDIGSFATSPASTIAPYKAFFNGIAVSGSTVTKPDVINSSWGGDDPAATSKEIVAIDGLARQNADVAFVVSAGNSGTSTVGAPGSGYNNITVGSVTGTNTPSEFSSRGPADFYDPQRNLTYSGVRAAVDIAAPGESMFVAAYLGQTGSLGASTDPDIQNLLSEDPADNLYFRNMDGTSFAAPVVAGGIALLKDRANLDPELGLGGVPTAKDTRVIKSVIMASAQQTSGWDNGQDDNGSGVIVTTQSLDYATGAGSLDLVAAAKVYLEGTRDVSGDHGGDILSSGWDMAEVSLGDTTNSYAFANSFAGEIELTISLNWFSNRSFDNDTDMGADLSFADLNLQLWMLDDGSFQTLIAESSSIYNNSEFLRVMLDGGSYGIRVIMAGLVYDVTGSATSEQYGLAWQAKAVPEPGTALLFAVAGLVFLVWKNRPRRTAAN